VKPDYTGLKPLPAVSQITPRLWQGKRPKSYVDWNLVVSCEEHLARKPMESYSGVVIHVPMRDEDDFVIPTRAIGVAALAAEAMMREGGKVLVHCSGGLNRSSLVTMVILTAGLGMQPRDALALLRVQRDDFCLCNRAFERHALGEPLPTAETSIFRSETQ
jgi:protein-tyrosine phosphatase